MSMGQVQSISLLAGKRRSMIQVVNQDIPAFSGVYTEWRHKIYSYVYYRVGSNAAVAEDIVSDVFLKAYQKYDSYNPDYALSTWLYTIARNTLIDYYRKGKASVDVDEIDVADETDPLYRLITADISLPEVARAVAALPEQQQAYIRAQFFEGKTAKEIAVEAGASHAAVRKTVSRGIAALRSALLQVTVCISFIPFGI